MIRAAALAAVGAVSVLALVAHGQSYEAQRLMPEHEFDFARLVYAGGGFRYRGTWDVDYPEAEFFFHKDRENIRELAALWRPDVPVSENPEYLARARELNSELETALVAHMGEDEVEVEKRA